MTVVMYDDVNVDLLPDGAAAYAGYTGGNWPNYSQVKAKFPGAFVLAVDVSASSPLGDCLDVETGDATNAQAPGWFRARVGKTQTPKPVIYTSASNVAALVQTMANAGIPRSAYFLWSAHYSYVEHCCGSCGYPQTDATQWTDRANGTSLDQSLVNTYMLPGGDMPLTQADAEVVWSMGIPMPDGSTIAAVDLLKRVANIPLDVETARFQHNGQWVTVAAALDSLLTLKDEFEAWKTQSAPSTGAALTAQDDQNIAAAVVAEESKKLGA